MYKNSIFLIIVVQQLYLCHSVISENVNSTNFIKNMGKCFGSPEIGECLHNQVFEMLDNAINDNRTWIVNSYITFEKDPEWEHSDSELNSKSVDDTFSSKLKNLVESRTLHFQWNNNAEEEDVDDRKGKKLYASSRNFHFIKKLIKYIIRSKKTWRKA